MTARLLDLEDSGAAIDFARMRAGRRARLVDTMKAHDLDVLILGRPANVRYASGARQLWTAGVRPFAPACVVVAATGDVHLLSVWDEGVPREIPRQNLFGLSWNPEILVRRLAAIPGLDTGGRVGVDALSPAFADLLPWELHDATAALEAARAIKTEEEVAAIATAAAVAEAGLMAMVDALATGVSERALVAVFAEHVARLGVPILASEAVACATEPEGPVGYRQLATERAVERGQLVVLTPAVLYAGYEGSIGRTYAAGSDRGEPPSGRAGELRRRCHAAQEVLIDGCRAGKTGADVRRSWETTGEPPPPPAIPLAHGSGLGVEPPLIGDGYGADAELEAGMVLAVQSWVAAEGTGGCLERDLVLVRNGPPERLTGRSW